MNPSSIDSTDLRWLAGLARALLRDEHGAEDLAQDAAVAALQRPWPLGISKRVWLASVLRRLAARHHRSKDRRLRRESMVARPEALPDSAELLERAEVAECLVAATRELREPFRRCLLLRFLEGLSPEQIAEREGDPVDTIRWRVRRGLELLRQELQRKHDRDWSAWCVLLMPLSRGARDAGLVTAGVSSTITASVTAWLTMKAIWMGAVALLGAGLWMVLDGSAEPAPPIGLSSAEEAKVELPSTPERGLTPGTSGARSDEAETLAQADTRGRARAAVETESLEGEWSGQVVAADGQPVEGATVYLIPSLGASREEQRLRFGRPRFLTTTDAEGRFTLPEFDREESPESPGRYTDVGVLAEGFVRRSIPDIFGEGLGERERIVLSRGERIAGFVVDEWGKPVVGLDLLAYSGGGGIDHVSPSSTLLRARRATFASSTSTYFQSRARSDSRGAVEFLGLPNERMSIRCLDPDWSLISETQVDAGTPYVLWTVRRGLAVQVKVFRRGEAEPVQRVYGIFKVAVEFATGEVEDYEQWVGSGEGQVSFALTEENLPPLIDRVVTRATFYGTVTVDEQEYEWRAKPLVDRDGAKGLAEVRLEIEDSKAAKEDSAEVEPEPVAKTRVELDVAFDDGSPFVDRLYVSWMSEAEGRNALRGSLSAQPGPAGSYLFEVPAGEMQLVVQQGNASGSLPPAVLDLRGEDDGYLRETAVLSRGASVTLMRPESMTGGWHVRASRRMDPKDEWFGSWNYGTDESQLTLEALQTATWRFEFTQDNDESGRKITRTLDVESGQRLELVP